MTVDVMVDGWHEQDDPKEVIRLVDKWDMENSCFAGHGYEKDSEGFYIEEVTHYSYPSMNVTSSNLAALLEAAGYGFMDAESDSIKAGQISQVIGNVMRALNIDSKVESVTAADVIDGNTITFGRTEEYVKRRLAEFLDILKFAADKGVGVYWA